ncbi:BREX-1 system adenine-specific DNA-methyltransferase PglX [Crassaminicella thermophila]|uniref:site-specific DNA-methyltransferase (adenine-specific) n=1 Tax=Crassaminicella thermophila TaxID=2599308 RepID=A0A5C0S9C7_CRATE|nr:BREX-1 system adenine-specific DNA-methyltransferase PglX [Crassaminicella thermophila]QEK11275.1 BREX-1 system adenine-specific DNA-methyltransferase PglX [Crassaminicella thermophila]
MNKKNIKHFAIHVRERIMEKASCIESKKIEDIAYQSFFYLLTLRYMEVNDYLPKDLCVFSCIGQYKTNEALKNKLLKTYDALSEMLPFIFEPTSRDVRILAFDLLNDSLIKDFLSHEIIFYEDWKEVENIGWFYQYYMEEKHKEVVRLNNSRIKKEDIPAATQLFTPKWIVKYMVENTLGKYWIEATKDQLLEKRLAFYIKQKEMKGDLQKKIDPKSIKVLDPACGAGHILVYAFDLLYEIYLNAGYDKKDIPKCILKNNLYGLDIDKKAVRLALFSLVMKGREKDDKFLHKIKEENIIPSICCIEESNELTKHKTLLFEGINENDMEYAKNQINRLIETFYDGKEYGSIISIKGFDEKFWNERLAYLQQEKIKGIVENIIRQVKIINQKYEVVIANPPYLSNKMMSLKLKKYVDQHFKLYNGDLFSVFMKRSLDYTSENGYTAFMTPFVWMFIKRYENLRKYVLQKKSIESLIQLEYSSFEEAIVPICTFVLRNQPNKGLGDFIKLSDFKGAKNQPIKVLEAIKNEKVSYRYRRLMKSFEKIQGMPIAYWANHELIKVFQRGIPLKNIADTRVGLQTSDNKRFVRLWHEVDINKIGFKFKDRQSAKNSGYKWFPYNKGGEFRKWYGNLNHIVNWQDDGKEIREYNAYLNRSRNSNIGIANADYYFKQGITWSFVSSSNFGVRIMEEGFIFDTAGSSAFPRQDLLYFLIALLCSKITYMNLMIINPTLNFQPGNIAMLPVIFPDRKEIKENIDNLAKECIKISKMDWNDYETSWDFKRHPFLIYKNGGATLKEAFDNWKSFKEKQFNKLKEKEEKLNKMFMEIYNIEEKMIHSVEENDITIKKADFKKDVRLFISYAVGCMFGRYSLDEEGLVFAGGSFNKERYKTYPAEEDGIIPIDDMALRFIRFLKITFGQNTLDENLSFIAAALCKRKSEKPIDCIKRYFQYEFYKDHIKTYQKRPIYWLFTSGKNKAFQALFYVHRYDKKVVYKIRKKYLHRKQKLLQDKIMSVGENEKIFIQKQIQELRKYDEELKEVEGIDMDLDDGVYYNYEKFKKVLSKI